MKAIYSKEDQAKIDQLKKLKADRIDDIVSSCEYKALSAEKSVALIFDDKLLDSIVSQEVFLTLTLIPVRYEVTRETNTNK